ncbi:MAG: porin family protein [Proteobacteria bacterium]|nr:porin family protein [Pseudomonadota bacterium]
MKKMMTALAVGVACAFVAPAAFAGEGQGFVAAEVGQSRIKIEGESSTDTSFAIRGGYMFNNNLGVEGFYGHYYDKSLSASDSGMTGTLKPTLNAYGVGVVGKWNLTGEGRSDGLFAKGHLGVMQANAKASATLTSGGTTYSGSAKSNSTTAYVGVGLGYDFNRNVGVSVNYDYFRPKFKIDGIGSSNVTVNTWSLGFEYRF